MKSIIKITVSLFLLVMVACESSVDISLGMDHEVPGCSTLTITANSETKIIPDSIVTKMLWGYVPEVNLDVITLPTVTATPGSIIDISITISDNDAIQTAELSYSSWLYSKYINFANPEGDIPLTPQSYTFTAQIQVPVDVAVGSWIENFYFNDGTSMKFVQSYHKLLLTLVDVDMNSRTIPIFVKVE